MQSNEIENELTRCCFFVKQSSGGDDGLGYNLEAFNSLDYSAPSLLLQQNDLTASRPVEMPSEKLQLDIFPSVNVLQLVAIFIAPNHLKKKENDVLQDLLETFPLPLDY